MNISKDLRRTFDSKGTVGWFLFRLTEGIYNDGESFSWRFLPLLAKFQDQKSDLNVSNVITHHGFDLIISIFKSTPGFKVLGKELEDLFKEKYFSIYAIHKFFDSIRLKYKGPINNLIEAGFWSSSENQFGFDRQSPERQINFVAPIYIAAAFMIGDSAFDAAEKALIECLNKQKGFKVK